MEALRREINGDFVRQMLQDNHDVANIYSTHLPILIFAKRRMKGVPPTNDEMFQVLEKALGVRPLD